MAPHLVLDDPSVDFSPKPANPPTTTTTNGSSSRTLLLAPPSLSSQPDALAALFTQHPRATSDLQMLDRLHAGLVALPSDTYDLVLLVAGPADPTTPPLTRDLMAQVLASLKPGGRLAPQPGAALGELARREGILGGLTVEGDALVKPAVVDSGVVPLRFGRKKATEKPAAVLVPVETAKRKAEAVAPLPLQAVEGVGFVDFGDGDELIITGEDDDVIDEDEFITESDLTRPVIIPPECRPKPGKKRRACKDCSCGLKQQLDAEDAATRADADAKLKQTFQLEADDLEEIDFTVQGKVGSCGNCALGDAFRCDGCPYVGLPPFKPGEEVRLVNDEVQL